MPLSNSEARLDYWDVNDPAVSVTFQLVADPTTVLAGMDDPDDTVDAAVLYIHPEFKFMYIKIHDEEKDANYILCDKLLRTLNKDPKKPSLRRL